MARLRLLSAILIGLLACVQPAHAWRKGAPAQWNFTVDLAGALDTWWDTVDNSGITVSGGKVTSWAAKVGSRTATPVVGGGGPTFSASSPLVNNFPAVLFNNDVTERLQFSPAGLPSGTNPVTIVVVAYATADTAGKGLFSYGGGSTTGDSRVIGTAISGSSSGVSLSVFGYGPVRPNPWFGQSNVVLAEFFIGPAPSLMGLNVNGDSNQPTVQFSVSENTVLTKGRIGVGILDTGPWNGAVQGILIFNRILTTLEQDKLTGQLGQYYGQSAIISDVNPYKNVPPTIAATASSDLLYGYNSIWSDSFASLSLRSGNVYSGQSSGYVTGTGTWAPSGLNYMTPTTGYPDFGYGFFINPNFNWSPTDETFPPLGMINITSNGLELNASEGYPSIRAALPLTSGQPPFLSALLYSGFSTKVGIPYAVKVTGTITTNNFEFPAWWQLGLLYTGVVSNIVGSISATTLTVTSPGTLYIGTGMTVGGAGISAFTQITAQLTGTPGGNGTYTVNHSLTIGSEAMTLTPTHNEIDYFERFGNSNISTITNQSTHITANAGQVNNGGAFNLGGPSIYNTPMEVLLVRHSDFIYLFTNGVLVNKITEPAGFYAQDLDSVVLNSGMGMSFEGYPGSFTASMSGTTMTVTATGNGNRTGSILAGSTVTAPTGVTASVVQPYGTGGTTGTGGTGTYAMSVSQTVASKTMFANPISNVLAKTTVRKVEIFAPPSNTTFVVPPAPPVPVITWGGCCTGGNIPIGTTGTVATLSGSDSYQLLEIPASPSHLAISSSNLVTSGALSAGTYPIWINGTRTSDGWTGIAPQLTLQVNGATTNAFNPSDKSASTVLSNGNLTLTTNSGVNPGRSRSATAMTTGNKYCFEYHIDTAQAADFLELGISNLSTGGLPGVNSLGYWNNDGIYDDPPTTTILYPSSVGSVVRMAVDLVNFKGWIAVDSGRWNAGSSTYGAGGDPASNLGGIDISGWGNYYAFAQSFGTTSALTANFGNGALVYPCPSGFTVLP